MQKQGNSKSVVYNKPEYFDVQIVMMEILPILYKSPYQESLLYYIYKTVLIA